MPTVGLDIGHGSNTWERTGGKGVKVNGQIYEEHDFNSKLAIEVEKDLKRNGINVLLIQKPFSTEVDLQTRTDFYNSQKVDLVWSVHANANSSKGVNGICCFYWHDHAKSKRAAELFVDELNKVGLTTHGDGLHASVPGTWTDLHIVRETKMTAVLTENGFTTNPNDFKNIFGENQKEYIGKLAVVHTKTICRFFNITYKAKGDEIMNPSNQAIRDSVAIVLDRLSDKENGISPQWKQDFLDGKLTTSDAIGLIYVALERSLIQGEKE